MPTRRAFTTLAAAAPLIGAAAVQKRPLEKWEPGMKISVQIPTNPSDEDLTFVKQLGVGYVNIPTGGERATLETFIDLKRRVEAAGLKVWADGAARSSSSWCTTA